MIEAADRTLKKKVRKRVSEEGIWRKIESPWMNEEIREAMKERKKINRKKRNCKDPKEKEILEIRYQAQKEKVQILIR